MFPDANQLVQALTKGAEYAVKRWLAEQACKYNEKKDREREHERQMKKYEIAERTCNNCPYGYKSSEFCPNSQNNCQFVQNTWKIAGL